MALVGGVLALRAKRSRDGKAVRTQDAYMGKSDEVAGTRVAAEVWSQTSDGGGYGGGGKGDGNDAKAPPGKEGGDAMPEARSLPNPAGTPRASWAPARKVESEAAANGTEGAKGNQGEGQGEAEGNWLDNMFKWVKEVSSPFGLGDKGDEKLKIDNAEKSLGSARDISKERPPSARGSKDGPVRI